MDPQEVADALGRRFVKKFHRTFDSKSADLAKFYQEEAKMSFNGQLIHGKQAVVAKLINLPNQQCQHNISTVDFQPSGTPASILVFVTGEIVVVDLDGKRFTVPFCQAFQLTLPSQGGFYVLNDVFRSGKLSPAESSEAPECVAKGPEVPERILKISYDQAEYQ